MLSVYVIIEQNNSHHSIYCASGNYAGITEASEYCTKLNPVLLIQVITKSDQSYLIDKLGGTVYAAECDVLYFPND